MADVFDTSLAPTVEPESLVVGSYAVWRKVSEISDTAYGMSYRLTPLTGTARTIAGVYNTSGYWVFEVSSSATSGWADGDYRWDLLQTRTSDGEAAIIETGYIKVFGSAADRRTHAEIMVQKIESVLSGRADSDVSSYSIKSRSITKMSITELTGWRDYYLAEVGRTGGSSSAGKASPSNTVRVRWV